LVVTGPSDWEGEIDMMETKGNGGIGEANHVAGPVHRGRGRPKNLQPGNRLHIQIPETLTQKLLEIQRDTHASSITEVVKSALTLYAAAVEEHRCGGHVFFKRKDEEGVRQLPLFI
jgi:hypothetical protein